jgi:endogenous inhibitor of DNA gyrase (YacG/DUF329 family)
MIDDLRNNSKCEVCGKDGTWKNPPFCSDEKCPVNNFKKKVSEFLSTYNPRPNP